MITIPIAVHCSPFNWQLNLFWYAHQRVNAQAHAVIIKRNLPIYDKIEHMQWRLTIPHTMCDAFFDRVPYAITTTNILQALPVNIQHGLMQVLPQFADDEMIEVVDCDMFHIRPCPIQSVGMDELIVCPIYEQWHLRSLTDNRHIIEMYFENGGQYYNGGFVPLIGRAATFRRLLPEWLAVHMDILNRPYDILTHWWAGMFALQVACEKNRIQMRPMDCCYMPDRVMSDGNDVRDTHYIGHYSVDKRFNKHEYPNIDPATFPNNPYYRIIKEWMQH